MEKDKQSLRSLLIQKRDSLSINDRINYSKTIVSRLIEGTTFQSNTVLHCYCSFGSEVLTDELIQTVLSLTKQVLVPVVKNSNGELIHTAITSETIFEKGTYGIPQPTTISEVPIDKVNNNDVIIIVPIVGFDVNCHRIGYGGGYYDRFLQKVPNARKIGVAFSLQRTDVIPVEKTDIPLDEIITEQQVFKRLNGM